MSAAYHTQYTGPDLNASIYFMKEKSLAKGTVIFTNIAIRLRWIKAAIAYCN